MAEVHSTRLFPKGQGAGAYRLTGLAARCDLVVLSDTKPPMIEIRKRQEIPNIETIFVSLRAPFNALRAFHDAVLPQLTRPFVLFTGSEDFTLPQQTDARWRGFTASEAAQIATIQNHPLLRAWYAENLDDATAPKMHPLPLGLVCPDSPVPDVMSFPCQLNTNAPHWVLSADRLRDGPQWDVRRQVRALAQGPWAAWTTTLIHEVPQPAYIDILRQHRFCLCPEGGGLDPSPKAWLALLHGVIPILRRSPTTAAYAELPVIYVDSWTADALSRARLSQDATRLAASFCQSALQRKLSVDYWWRQARAPQSVGQLRFGFDGGRGS